MALTRVAVDYIREHRADSSDTSIRAALAGQGFSAEILDQAFAQAGPRPAAAPAPLAAPVPAAPAASKRRIWPWVLGSVVGAFVLAVAGMIAIGAWYASKDGKRKLPAAVADYHPARLSEPANLPRFLPDDLLDEDAGRDYAAMTATTGGIMDGDVTKPAPPPTAEQIALLDSALRKKYSTFGMRVAQPGLDGYVFAMRMRMRMLLSLSLHLAERHKAAAARGDWAQAEREAKRFVLLGWHNAQDWDLIVKMGGLGTAVGGLLYCSSAAQKLGKRDAAYILAAQRTPLDLRAYAPDPAVNDKIQENASDPEKLPALLARLSDPAQSRAYAGWTLFNVATTWSDEEKSAGRPAPARASFFLEAARSGDPDVRVLARNFDAVLKELESELTGAPAEKRADILDEINKRMAPKGPINF